MATQSLTVAEFIELPIVQAGLPELVAGAEGTEAEVRWVHPLDIPEVSDLLRGGEMILTTGVSIGSDSGAQRRFVRDLQAEGAVGLAVELGFAWERELPPALVEEADRRGLPVVAFRRGIRFVEVSEVVNGSLLDSGHALARRGEELHRVLDSTVLAGEGAEAVLTEVARRVGNPVVLEDARGELVAWGSITSSETEVVDTWSRLNRSSGEADAEGAKSVQVMVRGRNWGRVTVLKLESEFDRFTPIALERAAVAVGLGLMRGGEEDELRARARGNLLFELAAGLVDPLAAARRASTLGFPRRHGRLVPVAAVWRVDAVPLSVGYEKAWAPLLPAIRAAMSEPDRPALLGSRGNCVLGVLDRGTRGSEPDDVASRERLADRFANVLSLHDVDPADVALSIGRTIDDSWEGLPDALGRARLAAEAGAVGPVRSWYDASRTEIGQLLLSIRGTPELMEFSDERLAPLLELSGDRGKDLLDTLETYLHAGGRKTETAASLGIERQSLYHRLGRIEEILDVDLKDGDTVLALHLAIMVRRHLHR